MKTKTCKICNEEKAVSEFHSTGFNTLKDGSKTVNYKPACKVCANAAAKRRFERKLENAGVVWECSECGYDKCKDALDFHHVNPAEKEFIMAAAWTLSEQRIKEEVSKCVILCANCHREVHAGIREIRPARGS